MKFKPKYCLPTSLLTRETYSDLICKLVSDGYVNTIHMYDFSLAQMWGYLGLSEYSEICLYDKPSSFLEINEWMNYLQVPDDKYYNVLTKEQVEEYLKC